jgi:hypothetical protein
VAKVRESRVIGWQVVRGGRSIGRGMFGGMMCRSEGDGEGKVRAVRHR